MSDHIDRVHLINSIGDINRRRQLIERCALDDIDTEIITLRLLKHKSFDYIADTVGLSRSQTGRRYKKSLQLLGAIIESKTFSWSD